MAEKQPHAESALTKDKRMWKHKLHTSNKTVHKIYAIYNYRYILNFLQKTCNINVKNKISSFKIYESFPRSK